MDIPLARDRILPLWRRLRFYYPLTAAGSVVLLVFLYLLGSAFGTHNAYAFLLSVLGTTFMGFAAVFARLQAFRLSRVQLMWDSSSSLYARTGEVVQRLHTGDFRPIYFFRLHFLIKGKLHAGRRADFYVRSEGASSAGGQIDLPLYFPLCGRLDVAGCLLVRDVFGLVRAQVTDEEERHLVVRPPLFTDKPPVRFQTMFSNEASRKLTNAEEEKYYMREYIAGDRLKDINWKASMRVSELITRISPLSPEESRIVHVELRHFAPGTTDSPVALVHLNYAKSWMLSFIYVVKRDNPSFQFRVVTGDGAVLVRSEEEMEHLAARISVTGFCAEPGDASAVDRTARERFIFTTQFDTTLTRHIASSQGVRCHVMRTRRPPAPVGKAARKVSFLGAFDPHVLPGLWMFRRSRSGASQGITTTGTILEETLRVKLL